MFETLLEKLLAGWLSRKCGAYSALVATVSALVGTALVGLAAWLGSEPTFHAYAQYAAPLGAAGVFLGVFAGLMGHQKPTGTTAPVLVFLAAILIAALCLAQPVAAQTTIEPTQGFVAQSGPLALHFRGAWSAASFTAERYDLVDWGKVKGNHVSVEGIQVIAPTPGMNTYLAGADYQPDLSALMKHVNIPAGTFGLFVNAGVGVATFNSKPNQIAWTAGGGAVYKLTSSLAWQPLIVNYGRVGAEPFWGMSTQFSYVFGK
jgi:hypothetical protein